jgi:hypothetical protein
MSSKEAKLSGEKLFHSIKTVRFLGKLYGTAHNFVKQQVLKYEVLEIEVNCYSDVPELAYVKMPQEKHSRNVFTIAIFGDDGHNPGSLSFQARIQSI